MTERGLTSADGSPACPFVAFEDERDERADRPDHRHRCFAEDPPAPRAHAHQEAYCLSSAFPVCPVFQDWARRESARARPDAGSGGGAAASATGGAGAAAAGAARADAGSADDDHDAAGSAGDASDASDGADEWSPTPPSDPPLESTPRRNPPRDWAAPPPWASSTGGARGSAADRANDPPSAAKPRPPEGAGLAGSAADRLASGGSFSEPLTASRPPTARPADVPSSGPDADLAFLVGGVAATSSVGGSADARLAAERAAARAADDAEYERVTSGSTAPAPRSSRKPSVSSTRSQATPKDKPVQREHVQHDGPSWERARRYEAYPQIRSRAGLPGLSRVAILGAAVAIAAVALFFLPALLGVGGEDEPSATPSASVVEATPTPEPTPEPEPTPQTYRIKEGDTLSAIAKEFGVTLDQLLEANAETISNPNRISVGDEIIIPTPPPDEVDEAASEEPASEEPAP